MLLAVGFTRCDRSFLDTVCFVVKCERRMNVSRMLKSPSGFFPVAMSLAALALVLVHVAVFGAARQADEGAAAHIWQILILGQLPILGFFAVRWLPQAPRPALLTLALQAAAAVAAIAPVCFLHF